MTDDPHVDVLAALTDITLKLEQLIDRLDALYDRIARDA